MPLEVPNVMYVYGGCMWKFNIVGNTVRVAWRLAGPILTPFFFHKGRLALTRVVDSARILETLPLGALCMARK